jgi:uncharacterized membrane protein YgdD (TMEM256/DUF423 family)
MLGAFGAHALKSTLVAHQMMEVWQTAVLYHLVHAVALLALAAVPSGSDGRLPRLVASAAVSWLVGTVLFSGSLYGLALGGPRALGPVTPVGGVLFLVGWGLVAIQGWRNLRGPAQPDRGS